MHLIERIREEGGFTMVTVVGAIFVATLFGLAAFAAADGDLPAGADDRERKQALSAAEAGVHDYLSRLVADPNFWRSCADPAQTNHQAIHQRWDGTGTDPRTPDRRATIPTSTQQYAIEVLPANGAATCDATDPEGTFIDTETGTLRIRSTGWARSSSTIKRSLVATFRRRGFLDYIYFTDLETQDPAFYARNSRGQLTREDPRTPASLPRRDVVTWATEECATRYRRDGRQSVPAWTGDNALLAGRFTGSDQLNPSHWTDLTVGCGEIHFVANGTGTDVVAGPLHTNDDILICGSPRFGRDPADDIEVSGPGPTAPPTDQGWTQTCGSAAPDVNLPGQTAPGRGTWRRNSPKVELPPSNVELKAEALPAYRFVGPTRLRVEGSGVRVWGTRENGQELRNQLISLPTDGVIWVGNGTVGAACSGYNPLNPYPYATTTMAVPATSTCGDAWVSGSYAKNLTITAENDLILENDITRSGDVLLGLISNNFIRVHHPTSGCSPTGGGSNNGGPGEIRIEAAILSLRHSFTVDSYWCGGWVGKLIVEGAIGQKFRGAVGTFGGSDTGYTKEYTYDDRLKFRSPPHFLDPVQSSWKLKAQNEQVPAR